MSTPPAIPARSAPQHARLKLAIGKHTRLTAHVAVTPNGLLAIGALVSAILLSTAAIVHTARR